MSTNYADIKKCLNTKCNWIDLNDAAKDSLKDIDMFESEKATELRWHEVFNRRIERNIHCKFKKIIIL